MIDFRYILVLVAFFGLCYWKPKLGLAVFFVLLFLGLVWMGIVFYVMNGTIENGGI